MNDRGSVQRSRKIRLVSVSVAAVVAAAVALVSQVRGAEEARARELRTLMELRRSAVGSLLETMRSEVVLWSSDSGVQSIIQALSTAWDRLGTDAEAFVRARYVDENPHEAGARRELVDAGDGSGYSAVHAALHPAVRRFLEHHGYDDVYMIDADGDLVYSADKETDFGTNLIDGAYAQTALGRVARAALDAESPDYVAFADFESYAPGGGRASAFIASPAIDDASQVIGVLAFRIPADELHTILQFTEGMGETGETYLVGDDLLMRSDSRFSASSTVLVQRVETAAVRRALTGETGVTFQRDYRDVPVLSAFGALRFEGVTWLVIAEQDRSEVRRAGLRPRRILAILLLVFGCAGALLSLLFVAAVGRDQRPAAWTTG